MTSANKPWYVDLYENNYYLQCCVPLIPPKLTAMEVGFMEAVLSLREGARVLDLCCGHGRHSLLLAAHGFSVTGVDRSSSALRQAVLKARSADVSPIHWVCSDMQEIPFVNHFDACINWFTSFGYLSSEDANQKVLCAINRSLLPGGHFLIDLTNHAWLMRNFQPYVRYSTRDGATVIEEREFDLSTGRNNIQVCFFLPNGTTKESRQSLRIYTLPELTHMLSLARLSVCRTWGDIDGSQYQIASPRMIVLSQKNGDA